MIGTSCVAAHIRAAQGVKAVSSRFGAGETTPQLPKLLHELLHNCFSERPETHQNHCEPLISHNNIRKVGSFRNRQVISSSLIVGSNITPVLHSVIDSGRALRIGLSVPKVSRGSGSGFSVTVFSSFAIAFRTSSAPVLM